MRLPLAILVAALAVVLAAGCQQPPLRHDTRATSDDNFNAVWDSAMEVLWDYRFRMDRMDRRAGVITTYPMVGRHWFEFWRSDAVTPLDVAEGTFQTIYRQATVTIRRAGGEATAAPATVPGSASEYFVTVEVRTSRSALPEPMMTDASEAQEMFTGGRKLQRTAVPATQPAKITRSDYEEEHYVSEVTVDLGRDESLEKILQRKINSLAAKKLTLYPK